MQIFMKNVKKNKNIFIFKKIFKGSYQKNTHNYYQTVINETIHKYTLKKVGQIIEQLALSSGPPPEKNT